MIILDTNVLSELMKPKKSERVRNWAAQQSIMNLLQQSLKQKSFMVLPYSLRENDVRDLAKQRN